MDQSFYKHIVNLFCHVSFNVKQIVAISEFIGIDEVFEVERHGHDGFSEISESSVQDFVDIGKYLETSKESPNPSSLYVITVEKNF